MGSKIKKKNILELDNLNKQKCGEGRYISLPLLPNCLCFLEIIQGNKKLCLCYIQQSFGYHEPNFPDRPHISPSAKKILV